MSLASVLSFKILWNVSKLSDLVDFLVRKVFGIFYQSVLLKFRDF